MTDLIEQFFNAYWQPGMKMVFREEVPKEMIQSKIDEDGWYEWKILPGRLTIEDYQKIENHFNVVLPENFIEWHRRYFFEDGDCSIIRLPSSLPTRPLEYLRNILDWHIPQKLIPQGLVPFADEGNDTGPLVFDLRGQLEKKDFPIRVYDHEYQGDLDGLSEIIFSSFNKLLECLTHYLIEKKTQKNFKILPDFFSIDPDGAGSTGRIYWENWMVMQRENFEEFGY
ncbi:SMI1/KNR4 family protein [Roseivirga misakiensis]|uniref:Knr4/Smi1-like domain-containing protein n=1 Tax=Roseivirga misakiensis TaxID=1563681 RepID=A0A1E5SL71_9BACT|nr:SMI1/KNR4 family protein [Roseivirga misakiensis]OEJ99843.1 hypothetical protein BFP71_09845 [Roseivirga misakiensis]